MAQPIKKQTSPRDTAIGCGCLAAIGMVIVAVVLLINAFSGGGTPSSEPHAAARTSPAAATESPTATGCARRRWPSKVPDVVGKPYVEVIGDAKSGLKCFHVTRVTGPMGDDVLADPSMANAYAVHQVHPAPGTLASADTRVELDLTGKDTISTPGGGSGDGNGGSGVRGGGGGAPAAPPGATAKCNDGTYSYSQHRRGTCSHHHGVQQWLNSVPE